MNHPFQYTITLKQHTPMIHFQHDHTGATLRATEVKPKLDRFLIEYGFGGMLNLQDYGKYLVGDISKIQSGLDKCENNREELDFLKKQKLAFDYRMRIESNKRPATSPVEIMPSTIETCFFQREVTIIIFCLDDELRGKIEGLIPLFFSLTNFGKRQSKGFGCFYPIGFGNEDFERLLSDNHIPPVSYTHLTLPTICSV